MRPNLFTIFSLLLFFLFYSPISGNGQPVNSELGQPLIRTYLPEEFNSSSTCIDIVQNEKGIIYVANEGGILEYDGVSWRLIPITIGGDVMTLVFDESGVLYLGGTQTLGYLKSDDLGRMHYISLGKQLKNDFGYSNFGYFRESVTLGNDVYFRGEKLLIRIRNKKVEKVWEVNGWRGTFQIDGRIYIDQLEPGLTILDNDRLTLVPGGDRFAGTHIYTMFPFENRKTGQQDILLGTMNEGLFVYNKNGSQDDAFRPFSSSVNDYLKEHQCYSGIELNDDRFAFGTFTGGIVVINSSGEWLNTWHKFPGITVRLIEDLYLDHTNRLWFTSESGISKIEIQTPLTFWSEEHGLTSRVSGINRFNGRLFFASYSDLLILDPSKKGVQVFKSVENLGKIINPTILKKIQLPGEEEKLIVGGSSGFAEISKQMEIKIIRNDIHANHIYYFTQYPDHLYILDRVQDLIRSFVYTASSAGTKSWIEEGVVEVPAPTFLASQGNENLWVGTYQDGFALLKLQASGNLSNANLTFYTESDGLFSNEGAVPFDINGTLYFQTDKGTCQYDEKSNRFIPDSTFNSFLEKWDANYLVPDNLGNLQLFKREGVEHTLQGVAFKRSEAENFDEAYFLDKTFRKRLPKSVPVVYSESNGTTWFGTNKGVYRYDLALRNTSSKVPPVLIRKVTTVGDSILFWGSSTDLLETKPIIKNLNLQLFFPLH